MGIFKLISKPGQYRDNETYADVINYILNRYKTHGYCGGWSVDPDNAAYEMESFASAVNKDDGLLLRHFVISFEKNKKLTPKVLDRLGLFFSEYYGKEYQIIYGVHLDTEHPHIHFAMSTVNYHTLKKYSSDENIYKFLTHCNSILQQMNINEKIHYVPYISSADFST